MISSARTIGVVTVNRSDYGIYLPILRGMKAEPSLRLHLMVTGAHLSPEFGSTVRLIEADGFTVQERIEMLLSSDTPEGTAKSMGVAVMGFAQAYARCRPDLLLVLGDRCEMYAAAVAAVPFTIPIAHVHGGELTEGAMDEGFRHSLTKLSHLHFVSTDRYRQRVLQLGEESWRVVVSGAPGLDHLRVTPRLSREQLQQQFGVELDPPPLLITYHPVTLEPDQAEVPVQELLEALASVERPLIFTLPNPDPQGRQIRRAIDAFVRRHSRARMVDNFGSQGYFSLMAQAAAMVGNSSSGIIEAPSFGLPVVNIGSRQQGRVRAANVIDVGNDRAEIRRGLERALSPEFRASLQGIANPYGDGLAAERIIRHLKEVELSPRLLKKRFMDLELPSHTLSREEAGLYVG